MTLRSDRSRRPFMPAANQRRRPIPSAAVALSPEGVNCHLGDLCNLGDNLPPRCSLGSARSLVGSSRWRQSCHSNRKLSDRRVVVNMPLISPAARRALGPLCSRRRIKFPPARAAASVQLVARDGDKPPRDGRARRLGRCFAPAWVWTHHPPRGRAENPKFSPVNTCPVNGLPPSSLRGAAFVFTRQLLCLLWVTRVVVSASRIARRVFACL
jgi:hypothetical protein